MRTPDHEINIQSSDGQLNKAEYFESQPLKHKQNHPHISKSQMLFYLKSRNQKAMFYASSKNSEKFGVSTTKINFKNTRKKHLLSKNKYYWYVHVEQCRQDRMSGGMNSVRLKISKSQNLKRSKSSTLLTTATPLQCSHPQQKFNSIKMVA